MEAKEVVTISSSSNQESVTLTEDDEILKDTSELADAVMSNVWVRTCEQPNNSGVQIGISHVEKTEISIPVDFRDHNVRQNSEPCYAIGKEGQQHNVPENDLAKPTEVDSSQKLNVENTASSVQEESVVNENFNKSTLDITMEIDSSCTVSQDDYVKYNFTIEPYQLTGAWKEFQSTPDNYLRGCKWAPDGSCILTNSNDGYIRFFNLPGMFFQEKTNEEEDQEMKSVLKIYDCELIYDYCWYPLMKSLDPDTCCILATGRGSPVHLFDAYTGELRSSYKGINNVDELEVAHSLCFSSDGQKIYSGYNNTVRVFDVAIPGRKCVERKTKDSHQSGIISCITVNPADSKLYAVGSYLKSVALYAEPDGTQLFLLQGQQGGITHMVFSEDGSRLYCGARKDSEIICWDLRNTGEVLFTMQRKMNTNQRIYFEASRHCAFIVSGDEDGFINVWNADEIPTTKNTNGEILMEPVLKWKAHDDCVNGISFHPSLPLLASSSGQRKNPEPLHSEDDDSDTEDIITSRYIFRDNSLRLWWLGQ